MTGAGARRLAARGRRRRRRRGRRRLVREGRRQLGPLPPPLPTRTRSRGPSRSGSPAAPATDTDVVLATAPDGKVWMAWQSLAGRPGRYPAGPGRAMPARRSASANDPPTSGRRRSPSTRAGASTSPSTAIAAGNYESCSAPAAATARSARRWRWPGRRSTRRGRAWRSTPMGRVWVAYEERTDELGQGRREPDRRRGLEPLPRRAAVRVRCVDGDRVLDAPDPVADARRPARDHEQLSAARRATARAGSGWRSAIARKRSGATTP